MSTKKESVLATCKDTIDVANPKSEKGMTKEDSTPQTFRTEKLQKFIQKKVDFMEMQQKVINSLKQQNISPQAYASLEFNQTAIYNMTFELCQEFKVKMPVVLGVTPNT